MRDSVIDKPIISADSHITEPPDMYKGRVAGKYADLMPKLVRRSEGGEVYVIEGMADPFPITLTSSAGKRGPALAEVFKTNLADCHPGGWDPKHRLADQDRDGIAAEVIYPSLGMVICNHPDADYQAAAFGAYNEWLAEYCSTDNSRLIGLGQTAMSSPEQGIKDLERMKAQGMKGVMMPGYPVMEDYDSPIYDPFWEAAVALQMPISFHILTYRNGQTWRGPRTNRFMGIIRGNQDIIGAMIFSGVFERHPGLKLVCAEADAGWAPHFMYRMDHTVTRNPFYQEVEALRRKPSEYFNDNVYLTFQDDETAYRFKDSFNMERMLWASDFPHVDSTWPHSQALLAEQTASLSRDEKEKLLHDNVAALYGLAL